jgi:glyoxylase-like metal-dependent hydrolase (beta-lactamase superfamily II)
MPFLTEPEPPRGRAEPIAPGVLRVVAANPSVMTYHGTNTWLIEGPDGFTVLDPGPDDPAHVQAILGATGGRVARILLTHTHHDHLGATAALKQATGAPTFGFRDSAEPSFDADVKLDDGDQVAGMTALHTPGHAPEQLCFARPDGALFSGDHVMSWNSSIVNPPKGDMAAYFASLERLLARDDRIYLPGHGPKLPDPQPFVRDLLKLRQAREEAIEAALRRSPADTRTLADTLYSQTHPMLRRAAERNVIAHLLKLEREGRAVQEGEIWRAA